MRLKIILTQKLIKENHAVKKFYFNFFFNNRSNQKNTEHKEKQDEEAL